MAVPTSAGIAIIDLVCATAVLVMAAGMTVPVIGGTLAREKAMAGAQYLAGQLQRARIESLRRATSVALRVEVVDDRTSLRLFVDGNGNGVQQREIDRGTDRALTSLDWLDHHVAGISLRIVEAAPDIGGGGSLAPGSDPLRIGRTALLVFSPLGSSSSGTLYVAAERGPQMAVRVYGATGRSRVLAFNAQARLWQP